MPGRFSDRDGQSSGRGRGQGRGSTARGGSERKAEFKFHPHTMGKDKQGMSFEKIREKIILHISRECDYGNDIARGIREGKEVDLLKHELPVRKYSQASDPNVKLAEDATYQMIYEKDVELFSERVSSQRKNKAKV